MQCFVHISTNDFFPSTCIISKKNVSVRKTTFWESSICLSPKSSRQISETKVIHLRNEHQEKKNMMENCNPNSLGKNRVVCFVWKKSWFDSVNSLIWFFHAGKLHQVSHLMCWRWTSVAKNNHWSFRCPRFFGHFWNPFGAAHSQESTTNFEGTMIRQQGDSERFPNFLDQLPLLEKLSAGTSRLHQFFEKEN